MAEALSRGMTEFIESVLRLQPKLAAFDCDGTLWSGDAGESFFWWELENGLVSEEMTRWARARYADYKAGKVSETTMCGEMVTLHKGLPEARIQEATDSFFEANLASGIFPEMQALVRRLSEAGCEVWAVSSSNQWIIRSALPHFGIGRDKILTTEAKIVNGMITDELIRVPSGPGKPEAIREVVKRTPDAAFGNSVWDREMLEMSKHPFAINANPDLAAVAREKGWRIYFPERPPQ
jgi:HAD superfamily phosphoserine phosphatase-like hydrolase